MAREMTVKPSSKSNKCGYFLSVYLNSPRSGQKLQFSPVGGACAVDYQNGVCKRGAYKVNRPFVSVNIFN
ncbi:hypothetical protein K0M31_000391 [Melipona bicolor]|uniref:Uncharacterized protein n=1 Tax=Melipona bicolor TaxID=60889 RepID=A0AA40GE94_9HYME|nr:hypothetical protein K0M31_000391 [Melipona bicolor]